MTQGNARPNLSTARLIGVLGDVHGDLGHLLIVAQTMWQRGVAVMLVLGDFGLVWRGRDWATHLDRLNRSLIQNGQMLYWLDGNRETFDSLYSKLPISDDGLRRLRSNIVHLPRGYCTTLASRKTLAVLPSASSADKHLRSEGKDRSPEEPISKQELDALAYDRADVLVGNGPPIPLSTLDAELAETDGNGPPEMRDHSAAGRRQLQRSFQRVRPKLYLGGHHQFIDETVEYGHGEEAFETRVVLLDRHGNFSQGVLDVYSLDFEAFARDHDVVTELTGSEVGRWRVTTQHSHHVFDFEARTVERVPGPDAHPMFDDGLQPLLGIDSCRVGERGLWFIRSFDDLVDYFWHDSTAIRNIERIADGQ